MSVASRYVDPPRFTIWPGARCPSAIHQRNIKPFTAAINETPKEAKVLVRLERRILMAMLLMELVVLVLTCSVHTDWVREIRRVGRTEGPGGEEVEHKDHESTEGIDRQFS
ncbi:hypothetical protein NL676_033515 [Syzygium grande]|nr:hypothetical protein NL676_033515 [Syzygium grande]